MGTLHPVARVAETSDRCRRRLLGSRGEKATRGLMRAEQSFDAKAQSGITPARAIQVDRALSQCRMLKRRAEYLPFAMGGFGSHKRDASEIAGVLAR